MQLSESRNAFTLELVNKLKTIVEKLVEKTREVLSKQKRKVSARKLKEELDRLYVYQIDYTQDIAGFIMFLTLYSQKDEQGNKVLGLLEELGNLIGMRYSREYN